MQNNSTLLKKTDLISANKQHAASQPFQPQPATLQKILQFASTYRVEKIADNQFIELFLN